MKRIVVGVLGLGVAGALAASGAAVAHMVTVGQRSSAHSASTVTQHHAGGTSAGKTSSGMTAADAGSYAYAGDTVKVAVKDAHGNRVAEVDITPLKRGGNLVAISAWNLKPGFHSVQLHAVGRCDAGGAAPFASAGGVLNPTGKKDTAAAGAFPVLAVGNNGRAQLRFLDGNFTIKDLSGKYGSSVVIHAVLPSGLTANAANALFADDTKPRIACGVVFRSHVPAVQPTPSPSASVVAPPPVQVPSGTPSTLQGHHW